jgi:photosystem II stability/assembly factor-like uncharacterized protein
MCAGVIKKRLLVESSVSPLIGIGCARDSAGKTMLRTTKLRKVLLIGLLTLLIASQASTVSAGTNVWTSIGLEGKKIYSLAIDQTSPSTLYAGTDGGVFKSTDGGATWSAVNVGLTSTVINMLAIDPASPSTLYVGTNGGVFKSTDGGAIWNAVNVGLTSTVINTLVIDPASPSTLYVGTNGGVFKSIDGGITWHMSNTGLENGSINVGALAINPTASSTIYAGTMICLNEYSCAGGVFKSIDGGGTWIITGLNNTVGHISTLVIDPTMPNTIYAGTWGLVFKSMDGGTTWGSTGGWDGGWPEHWVRTLAIDPLHPSTIYAGTVYGGIGSVSDQFREIYEGVFQTTNGGATWGRVNNGLTNTAVYALMVDPSDPSIVYAGTGNGVFANQHIQQLPSTIAFNHSSSAPGSVITVTGTNFHPGRSIKIMINGINLGSTCCNDSNGSFVFLLNTAQADEGRYLLVIEELATWLPKTLAFFELSSNEPTYPQEGSGYVWDLPSGIAFTNFIYLPFIRK